MKKIIAVLGVLISATALSLAHEFWMQSAKFKYKVGEEIKIDFLVGENFAGEFWGTKAGKVKQLQLLQKAGQSDLTKEIKIGPGNNAVIKAATEGTYLFSMESNAAFIELDAEKFNAYLEEDGLENIAAIRKERNLNGKGAKEFYTRYAKLLVQVGATTDDTYKKTLNYPVEITPRSNPYLLKTGDYLECVVMYEGKPCPHQLVKVWSKVGKTAFMQNLYTENDGTVKFPLSTKGVWMVSTVRMKPAVVKGADFQSMWGSLVFGIE